MPRSHERRRANSRCRDPREGGRGRADHRRGRGQLLRSRDLVAVGRAANEIRNRLHDPERVTFIIDRNLNYTNVCVTDCDFCAFYRRPGDQREGYLLPKPVIFKKIEETLALGGTGLLMQGGHHPDLGVDYYEDLFSSIKARYPIHLHALSPSEIVHAARRSKLTVPEALARMRDAGLDSIPGGGAEILVDRVRDIIAPKKVNTKEWLGVMREAHRLGHLDHGDDDVRPRRDARGAGRALPADPRAAGRDRRLPRLLLVDVPGRRQPARLARAGRGAADLLRLPADAGRLADLPRQRAAHRLVLGDAGEEDRPGRARLRRRRPRLGDDRGERRLGRRHDAPHERRGARPPDQRIGKVPVQRDTLYRDVKVWA